jgi:uncharacterized protein YebE (UPF0316 family)
MYDVLVSFGGLYTWVVMPLLIFTARVIDVSLGTVRVIFVARGLKYLAPAVGFFEILIWLLAIGQIMRNLSNPVCYIAYAGGFAMGNFVGIAIAEKLRLGVVLIRVITKRDALPLVERLQERGYGVTSVDGHGSRGQVQVVFTVVPRREVRDIVNLIKMFNPHAFYSIEEVGHVEKGIFPLRQSVCDSGWMRLFRPFRKGK